MSSIEDTIERYQTVSRDLGQKPSETIMKVLNVDREQCLFLSREETNLYLAGNNHLIQAERLTDDDCNVLYQTLKNNMYVTALDLRYNCITDAGAEAVGRLIQDTSCLKSLNLMGNDIEAEGAMHIAKGLHENETLLSIRMTGNKIGDKGAMCFAQALQINITLEDLDLADCDLKTESLIALCTVLNYNTTLQCLNVSRPILFTHQEEPTEHYARLLKTSKTLKELHMMKFDMRDAGVTRLRENLMDNFTLTYLNLSCNRISRDGMKEISILLKNDTSLKVLDLGYNRMQDDGAADIARSLATFNTHLTTIVCGHNEISGRGLCALADALKLNCTLTKIYIWGNDLTESACMAFASLIDTGRIQLKDTDVQPYSVDGHTRLSELPHSLRQNYYYGAAYGDNAQKELAQFT